jgi:hypothetical protein
MLVEGERGWKGDGETRCGVNGDSRTRRLLSGLAREGKERGFDQPSQSQFALRMGDCFHLCSMGQDLEEWILEV